LNSALPTGSALPAGTVTFLFTDIQGSTPLWESQPEKMAQAQQIHNTTLRHAIEAHGGVVFKIVGDSFNAAFSKALPALKAAIEGQRALVSAPWNELGELKVRMGLHTGEAELDAAGDEYAVSHTKNRVSRIMSAAHGGQVLLSAETYELVSRSLPQDVTLKDLGDHRLKGMSYPERLYQACAPRLVEEFPPLPFSILHPNNLPLQVTSFVGRQKEIEAVSSLLSFHRLVTLTGSGGTGKTRLSLQVAAQGLEHYPQGAWFVELAPLSDPALVPSAVARVLGVQEISGRSIIDSLVDFLKTRKLLLILDNCEHLLDACAALADRLLHGCPDLTLFASSREALGIDSETAYRLPSLSIPQVLHAASSNELQDYEAVQLFVERARKVMPIFQVSPQNAPAVIAICQRLDGIPLALELAASRLNLLTSEQLASRLDDAFRLLTGGSRTALPRQQTLRAAIDWSYNLLSDTERVLLRRLSVFVGGATLEAIEAVCASEGIEADQILDLLTGLVNKSMVNPERKQGEETRYRLLETVRQYAREKQYEAQESQSYHDRHLGYFLLLAETIEPQLKTPMALKQLEVLHLELDNFRAALSWALEKHEVNQVEAGLRLASALLNFWHTHSYQTEGYAWLQRGLVNLAVDQVEAEVYAKACFSVGHLIFPIGRLEEAQNWVQKSLKIWKVNGNPAGIVRAQSFLGEILAWSGNYDQSKELGEASVALCRGLNDAWLLAWALCRLGTSFFHSNQNSLAQPLIEESLAIFERLGDPLQVGDHFIMLGVIHHIDNDQEKARRYLNKAMDSAKEMKSKWTEANAMFRLGFLAFDQRDYEQMQGYLQQSVLLHEETGNINLQWSLLLLGIAKMKLGQPWQAMARFKECLRISRNNHVRGASLLGVATVAAHTGQPIHAARLLGACQNLADEVAQSYFSQQKEGNESTLLKVKNLLGEASFEQEIIAGQSLTLEQAIDLALEVANE
jgi:predicted ATPase/class 3 adenylate cyclase